MKKRYILARKQDNINAGRWWNTAWCTSNRNKALAERNKMEIGPGEAVKVVDTKTKEVLWEKSKMVKEN